MEKEQIKNLEEKIERGVICKCPRCREIFETINVNDRQLTIVYVTIPYDKVKKEEYHKYLCKY